VSAAEEAGDAAAAPPVQVAIVPVTPFQQNCSLVVCTRTGKAAFVDPGGDLDELDRVLGETGATLEKVLVTHGHLDHCGQAAEMAERHGVPIEGPHRDDAFWIDQLPTAGRQYGFPPLRAFTPSRWLAQGDAVTVGEARFEVLHCPGHTPGHVVFYQPDVRLAIVGDVLFRGSIGRTDFPRGNHADLIRSIRERLWPLGDDVVFVPGHGPTSSFGEERRSNPFVGDAVA
jgi:glyoxylase-like metal-dependent hydrolase (beta-lactamase superfamily II)